MRNAGQLLPGSGSLDLCATIDNRASKLNTIASRSLSCTFSGKIVICAYGADAEVQSILLRVNIVEHDVIWPGQARSGLKLSS